MADRVLDRVMGIADQLREQGGRSRAARSAARRDGQGASSPSVRSGCYSPSSTTGSRCTPESSPKRSWRSPSLDPASGWICGVVGCTPLPARVRRSAGAEEIWGADTDTWVASPYAPQGVATPVDGGYLFNGRWQFSSGTDACEWIFLGAMVGDADGKPLMPPQMLHMILPRKDYQIVEDSWNVVGLRGTGSKDVIVRDAFVPDYRAMNADRGNGRHRPAQGRDDGHAVPDAMVDDVPARHHLCGHRDSRGRAGRPP